MALKHNFQEFKREAQLLSKRVAEHARRGFLELAAESYDILVERTEASGSVDTGAYRAEHVIEQAGSPVFEHRSRPGPDVRIESRKRLGLPPLIERAPALDVRTAIEKLRVGDLSILQPLVFVNRRYYAEDLEVGASNVEPRQIYAAARDATAAEAERIAHEREATPL